MLLSTLAKFADTSAGIDTARVAQLSFSAYGDTPIEFKLFDGIALAPLENGERVFFVTGGKSEVAINYIIQMNAEDLIQDLDGRQLPIVLKISSADVDINDAYEDWFIPTDKGFNDIIDTNQFAAGSEDIVKITIQWWWNTSFFVGNPNSSNNSGSFNDYYVAAITEYESLRSALVTTQDAMNEYARHYASSADPDGNTIWDWESGFSESDYQDKINAVDSARFALNNCIKLKYDNYDSAIMSTLQTEPKLTLDVPFRVSGRQVD